MELKVAELQISLPLLLANARCYFEVKDVLILRLPLKALSVPIWMNTKGNSVCPIIWPDKEH